MTRLEQLLTPPRVVLVVFAVVALPLFAVSEWASSDSRAHLVALEQGATDSAAARAAELVESRIASLEDSINGIASNAEFRAALDELDPATLQRYLETYQSSLSGDVARLALFNYSGGKFYLARVPRGADFPDVTEYPTEYHAVKIVTHASGAPGIAVLRRVFGPSQSGRILMAEIPLEKVGPWLAPLSSSARRIDLQDPQGRIMASTEATLSGSLTKAADPSALAAPRGDDVAVATVGRYAWKTVALRDPTTVRAFDEGATGQRLFRVVVLGLLLAATYLVGRVAAQLRHASAELAAASRHKSEFLANMSHELRTPLNAVIGFSDVLESGMTGELTAKQREYVRDISGSGKHLLDLVNEILDLSKVEAGRMELEKSEFAVVDTVQSALAFVRERAARHRIELAADIAGDIGTVTADERKVRQVLLNLLSNAVKFTPDGGWIGVTARRQDGKVQISVRDTGIGIAPADQATVFEEFRQVGKADARSREGTGLGLTLAKRFVELHGGRIWLESEVGKGTTFTFALPVGVTPRATAPA